MSQFKSVYHEIADYLIYQKQRPTAVTDCNKIFNIMNKWEMKIKLNKKLNHNTNRRRLKNKNGKR